METYQESPDPSFAVRDTGRDPHWGWLDLACETRDLTVITYVLGTWDDPVNKVIPKSTQANFKGLPRTDCLTSPLKDTKENLLLNFRGKAECTQKRNKSLLQVGLEPWTF